LSEQATSVLPPPTHAWFNNEQSNFTARRLPSVLELQRVAVLPTHLPLAVRPVHGSFHCAATSTNAFASGVMLAYKAPLSQLPNGVREKRPNTRT